MKQIRHILKNPSFRISELFAKIVASFFMCIHSLTHLHKRHLGQQRETAEQGWVSDNRENT
jgi:hypothetical protein